MKNIKLEELGFCACTICNDYMYFFTEKNNLCIKMDIYDYKTELIFFEDDRNHAYESSAFLITDGNSIYKLQTDGKRVIEYVVSTKEKFIYEINESTQAWGNFSYMTIHNRYLYLFPAGVNKIIKIDLKKRKIIEKLNLSKESNQIKKICWRKGITYNKKVLLFTINSPDVFIYDLVLNTYKIISLASEIEGIVDITVSGDKMYLLCSKNKLFEWNFDYNELDLILNILNEGDSSYFNKIVDTDEKIILLPSLGEEIYILHKKESYLSLYRDYPNDFIYRGYENWAKYINESKSGDYVYFPMRRSCYILKIDKKTGQLEWISPQEPSKKELIDYHIKKKCDCNNKNNIYLEEKLIGLEELFYIVNNSITE